MTAILFMSLLDSREAWFAVGLWFGLWIAIGAVIYDSWRHHD